MNTKFKAGLMTMGFFIGSLLIVIASHELPAYVLGSAALVFLGYIMYSVILAKLEFDKKIDEIKDKNK